MNEEQRMDNFSANNLKCQELCAKAQSVLEFLSTFKMLISGLKSRGFAKHLDV